MTSDALTCTRCGHEGTEGRDVAFRLTSLEDEAREDGGRVGTETVAIHVNEDRHGPRGMEYSEVPKRFSTEARCVDRAACRGRVAVAGQQPTVEERVPWL